MVASCSAMHYFMLTVYMVVFVATTWSSARNESVPAYDNQGNMVYSIYKKLEDIVTNDKETLYKLKQAFFPALQPHFWESARVNVVLIRVCVITDETMMKCNSSGGNNSMFIKTQCWSFRWSSSPALTRITIGQLFAFDPVFAPAIYRHFIGGRGSRESNMLLHITSTIFPCVPLESDFTRAVLLLLSWSKAYAKAQGLPITWSQEDQGYIARYYGYYETEGYGTERTGSTIRKALLAIFILLNLFVLYTTITHGKRWYCRFCDTMKERSVQLSKIILAAGISTAIFNLYYFTSTVWSYTHYLIRTSGCDNCSPPHTSSYYNDEVTSLIIKGAVFFISIIAELLVAIQISILPKANRCSKCFRIVLLWNMSIFVQIWVGLLLVPACIFLIIAPLQTIPVLGAGIVLPLLLMLFVVILLQLGSQVHLRNWDCKINTMLCIYSSRHMIFVALVIALMTLYFYLSPGGTSLSSTEGILFSLIPSFILSATAWGIKRRYFNNTLGKGKKTKIVSSASTEQDVLQTTEQNVLLNNVVESGEEQSDQLTGREELESQSSISVTF